MKSLLGYVWTLDAANEDAVEIGKKDDSLLIVGRPKKRGASSMEYKYRVTSPSGSKRIKKTLGKCKDWTCADVYYQGQERRVLRGTVSLKMHKSDPGSKKPRKHKHHVWMVYPDFAGGFSGHIDHESWATKTAAELLDSIEPTRTGAFSHDGTYHSGN